MELVWLEYRCEQSTRILVCNFSVRSFVATSIAVRMYWKLCTDQKHQLGHCIITLSVQPDWLARVQAVVTCKGALLLWSFFKKGL